MGFVVEDVFGFEYIAFASDSMHRATFASQIFHPHGLDMDYQFQIRCAQNGNNKHPFKLSARLY
jgi:hypothetical protein